MAQPMPKHTPAHGANREKTLSGSVWSVGVCLRKFETFVKNEGIPIHSGVFLRRA